MKIVTIGPFLILILQIPICAQCPVGDIFLSTQSQVDSFRIMYPDCSHIDNDLIVGIRLYDTDTTSNIKCLDSLLGIQDISGSFYVIHNDSLSTLRGLDSLEEVAGSFYIGNNNLLSDLSGLGNVERGGRINIRDNASLKSFHGLNGLKSVDEMYLQNNDSLHTFQGVGQIESVGYLAILDNDRLENLNGFDSLGIINGDIFIAWNSHLLTLDGLSALDTIDGGVFIYGNYNLIDCSVQALCNKLVDKPNDLLIYSNGVGCSSLDEISDSCGFNFDCPPGITFYSQNKIDNFPNKYPNCSCIKGSVYVDKINYDSQIYNFDSLYNIKVIKGNLEFVNIHEVTNFTGFHNLDSVYGNLRIDRMNQIETLEGFSSLKYIAGELKITSAPRLKSVAALGNLDFLGGELSITWNDSLLSLNGLQGIDSIFDDFYLRKNVLLKDFIGLDTLNYIEGDLHVWGNDSLRNFTGLENLEVVGRHFFVSNNSSLEDFRGLVQLDSIGFLHNSGGGGYSNMYQGLIWSVGGRILIEENQSLVDLSGLENIKDIKGSIAIGGNQSLQSLNGLEGLSKVGWDLYIYANNALTSLESFNPTILHRLLGIKNNEQLSSCDIELVCTHLNSKDSTFSTIENNAGGCNSQLDIMYKCTSCPNCILIQNNVWIGTSDNNWHTSTNWSLNEIPGECHSVLIPNGSEVIIQSSAECYSLTIELGATLIDVDQVFRVACESRE